MVPCAYLRVSSRVQAEANGAAAQRHALTEWLKGRNIEVPPEAWFEDLAESGRKQSRPAFDAMQAALAQGKYDTLIVYSLSRLGRKAVGLLQLVEWLKGREVRLVVLKESIDSSTAPGRLFLGIIASLAEFEAELVSERTRAGMAARRAKGLPMGAANVPVGKAGGMCLTTDQRAELAALYAEGGWTQVQLGERFGCHEVTVRRLLKRNRPKIMPESPLTVEGQKGTVTPCESSTAV